jgi:diguanylate cyclase (GGDEF)-like protein/PAS domain S-box-containing protein
MSEGGAPGATVRSFEDLGALWSRLLGLAEAATLGQTVETCLEQLGLFTGADMAFVNLADEAERSSDDWNWVRPGLTASPPSAQTPMNETFGSSVEFLRLGHTLAVADLEALELSAAEKVLVSTNQMRAIVLVPVRAGGTLLGVMGLAVCGRANEWDPYSVSQIELLAQALVNAVVRHRDRGSLAVAIARSRRIAEFLPDGLLLLHRSGDIGWASPLLATMVGVDAEALCDQPVSVLVHADDQKAFQVALEMTTLAASETMRLRIQGPQSAWRWADLSWRIVSDPSSGAPDEIVMTIRDAHEIHLYVSELARQSRRDAVTGLVNRATLELLLKDVAERRGHVVLAFCDIDAFKSINDRFGHDIGDQVLRSVGEALRAAVRPQDEVARIGGDEFLVVTGGVDPHEDAALLGERLVATVRDLPDEKGLPRVTISVGVCGPAPAQFVDVARRASDGAMYRAKRQGRDRSVHTGWPPDLD